MRGTGDNASRRPGKSPGAREPAAAIRSDIASLDRAPAQKGCPARVRSVHQPTCRKEDAPQQTPPPALHKRAEYAGISAKRRLLFAVVAHTRTAPDTTMSPSPILALSPSVAAGCPCRTATRGVMCEIVSTGESGRTARRLFALLLLFAFPLLPFTFAKLFAFDEFGERSHQLLLLLAEAAVPSERCGHDRSIRIVAH